VDGEGCLIGVSSITPVVRVTSTDMFGLVAGGGVGDGQDDGGLTVDGVQAECGGEAFAQVVGGAVQEVVFSSYRWLNWSVSRSRIAC
jgi:hypothetical protein